MTEREKIIKGAETHVDSGIPCEDCPYWNFNPECYGILFRDAAELLKEQEKEIKALRLLVEWAEECGFGFDQFQDKYERYKDEVKDMKYIDGMIYVAKRTLEDREMVKCNDKG